MDKQAFLSLLNKYLNNQATPDEIRQLHYYYQTFQEADKSVFSEFNFCKDEEEGLKRLRNSITANPERNTIRRKFFKYLAAASIVLLTISSVWFYQDTFSIFKNKEVTRKGEHRSITLSDGTKILLNASTQLIFPKKFSGDTREVELTGEAYFEVAHDKNHPFIIHTRQMDIRVLGTVFNVKAYPEDASSETSLISGSVEITTTQGSKKLKKILKPSEKLTIYASKVDKESPAPVIKEQINQAEVKVASLTEGLTEDQHAETEWMSKTYVIRNERLADAAKVLERMYDVDIHFENKTLEDLKISLPILGEDIEPNLKNIKEVLSSVNYRKEAGNRIIFY